MFQLSYNFCSVLLVITSSLAKVFELQDVPTMLEESVRTAYCSRSTGYNLWHHTELWCDVTCSWGVSRKCISVLIPTNHVYSLFSTA